MPAQVDWSRVIGRGELWRLCRAKLRLGPSQTFFQDRPTFFLSFARSQPNFRKSFAKFLTFEALPPHAPYPTKPRREGQPTVKRRRSSTWKALLTLEITYLSRLSWFPSVLMLFEVFSARFQAFGSVSNADLPSEKPQIRSPAAESAAICL